MLGKCCILLPGNSQNNMNIHKSSCGLQAGMGCCHALEEAAASLQKGLFLGNPPWIHADNWLYEVQLPGNSDMLHFSHQNHPKAPKYPKVGWARWDFWVRSRLQVEPVATSCLGLTWLNLPNLVKNNEEKKIGFLVCKGACRLRLTPSEILPSLGDSDWERNAASPLQHGR